MQHRLSPQTLITFFPRFQEYANKIANSETEEDYCRFKSLSLLLNYLQATYRETLESISEFSSHCSITFDLLYTILIPGTIFLRRCPITHEFQAMRLLSSRLEMKPSTTLGISPPLYGVNMGFGPSYCFTPMYLNSSDYYKRY